MATSLLFRSSLHHHHQFGLAKPNPFSPSPPSSFSPAGKGRFPSLRSIKMQGSGGGKSKVFVAGATGSTENRIVHELLKRGFAVNVGVDDLEVAKSTFACNDPSLKIVDYEGTVDLVKACKEKRVGRFILISSFLLNIAAAGQKSDGCTAGKKPDGCTEEQKPDDGNFPNALHHALHQALLAEKHIKTSGIKYTIIRPVSLRDDPQSGKGQKDNPLHKVSVSTGQVAKFAVDAISKDNTDDQVVEIIA
ncbi:uncharacterized protein At2g34460, chloroplastic-like isoform X2 [Punica granatum]|uniref:Uncharacterized protein At2g34460, chloroplastic-like isoform X2 n=1 Tax=Punica granatum TaxID=22663 RepID=A0A6P8DFE4_PUNGR|nr:uncharacterized protein At2g34460, chloroplastic-like isoform X2 [Punica granatum]